MVRVVLAESALAVYFVRLPLSIMNFLYSLILNRKNVAIATSIRSAVHKTVKFGKVTNQSTRKDANRGDRCFCAKQYLLLLCWHYPKRWQVKLGDGCLQAGMMQ